MMCVTEMKSTKHTTNLYFSKFMSAVSTMLQGPIQVQSRSEISIPTTQSHTWPLFVSQAPTTLLQITILNRSKRIRQITLTLKGKTLVSKQICRKNFVK